MTDADLPHRAMECARLVSIAETTLRKMGRRGVIPVVRVGVTGRGIRYIPRDVIAALRERSEMAALRHGAASGQEATR